MAGQSEYSRRTQSGYNDQVSLQFIAGTNSLVALVLNAAKLKPISLKMPAPAVNIRITAEFANKGLAEITVGNEAPMEYPLATWVCAHLDNYMLLAFLAYHVKGV